MKTKLLSIIGILLILQNIQAQTTDSQTNTVFAIAEGETFRSGITIERPYIKLTFGEIGGADFLAAQTLPINDVFKAYTPGNDVNGNKTGGTFYLFAPTKDGILSVGVKQNRIKPLYVEENGTALSEYNGITLDESQSDTYIFSFNVKAGCTYKLYCSGSKLGFYGFIFKWNSNSEQPSVYNFETAAEAVKNMKVGWNLTNSLGCFYSEEELDRNNIPQTWKKYNFTTKDYETIWGNPVTKPDLIKMLRKAGINAIRIPVAWWCHMELDGTIDRVWMNRVHEVVDYVIDQGMYCIINKATDDWTRLYPQDYDNKRVLFEKLWKQIAEEFKDYDEHLLFEGYNELRDKYGSWGFAASAASEYNADDAMEAYETLGKYAQSFVDVVRATGGNNKTRNLIVNTYSGANGTSDWHGEFMVEPLDKFKLPKDKDNSHLIIGVHAYCSTYSLQEAKRIVDAAMDNLNTYLVPKGVPIIISEWGADEEQVCWDKYPENTLAFARYFMEKARCNGFAAFDWTGPSSYGKYRSMPAFEAPELTTAILKGYYGDSYQPELLTTDNYDYQYTKGTFEGQWREMNLYDNKPLNINEYVGMKLEMAEVADPGVLRIVVKGSNDEQTQYEDIQSLSTTLAFDPSELGGKVRQVTIQNARYDGPYVAKVVRALFIKKDGSEQELDEISNEWGCDVELVMPRKQFVHTVEYDGIWTELNVFSDDIPLKLKNYKGIRIEFAEPVNPEEFHFRFYGDGSNEDLRPVNNGLSTTIDFESLKFNQTINRIVLQHTQEGKAEAKVICAWLIRQDGTEEYCELSPFWGCEIIKKEKYLDSSNPSGDANDDGVVNAADIVEAINAMNGNASVKFNFNNADMNNNGTIDNTDINMIVNIIIRNQ